MPLGPKKVSPGTWSAFNRYLYVNFKQISGERLGPLGSLVLLSIRVLSIFQKLQPGLSAPLGIPTIDSRVNENKDKYCREIK